MAFPYDDSYSDYEAHAANRYRCRDCGLLSLEVEDGRCLYCNLEPEEREAARAAVAQTANKAAWDKFYAEHPEIKR